MVSGITVNFKSANILRTSISKISPYLDEVIIINHSEEEKKLLEQLTNSKIRIYTHPNRGYAKGCNLGAEKAKGDFLIFFNPDTIVMDDTVSLLIEDLKKGYDIAVPKFLNPDLSFQPSTRKFPQLKHLFVSRSSLLRFFYKNKKLENEYFGMELEKIDKPVMLKDRFPLGGFFAIKKSSFSELGGFDERFFLYFEDTDFFKRAIERGYTIVFDPRAKIVHYHGYSQSSIPLKSNFHKLKSFYLYGLKHENCTSFLLLLAFILVFYVAIIFFLDLFDLHIPEKRWSEGK
ncbi:MAG: glycosyltransferase [candidate division WOR-3 bacterium]